MTDTQSAYREVIADLKRRRDRIDQLIGTLEALVGGQWVARTDADLPFRGMKVLEAAKAVLRESGKPMSPAAITEEIWAGGSEVSSANTVASILHRYAKENDDIFSPGRGLWGLRSEAVHAEPPADTSALAELIASSLSSVPPGPAGVTPSLSLADLLAESATSVPLGPAGVTPSLSLADLLAESATSVPLGPAGVTPSLSLADLLPKSATSVPQVPTGNTGKPHG